MTSAARHGTRSSSALSSLAPAALGALGALGRSCGARGEKDQLALAAAAVRLLTGMRVGQLLDGEFGALGSVGPTEDAGRCGLVSEGAVNDAGELLVVDDCVGTLAIDHLG